MDDHPDGSPISEFMSDTVYTVPRYEGPHVAARIMRNHHIYQLAVTEGSKVVGILSSYDHLP